MGDSRPRINAMGMAGLLLHDFPVGILPRHLAVAKRMEVATPLVPSRVVPVRVHFDMPVFAAASTKMLGVAVVDIRQAFETPRQRFPHVPFALEGEPPGMASPRHFQDAVFGEERHHAIKIVRVERLAQLRQCRSNVRRPSSVQADGSLLLLPDGRPPPCKAVSAAMGPFPTS